jgi:GNAT superfamily N-acetyltransferase
MEARDVPRSVALTDLMNWGFEEEDFFFMMELEPRGCFVALKDDEVIGVVTSISFGSVGWIGNVIVSPEERRRGAGATLVSEALNHLKAEGVTAIGLYAYRNVIPFYESLGFKADRDFSWLMCGNVSWIGESMPELDSRDLEVVMEFDEQCFGASRKRLLETIYNSPQGICGAILDDGKPISYLMATKSSTSAEIGPWICMPGREEEGFHLFRSFGKALHGLEAHVGVPSDRSDVINFLSSLGFAEDFPVVRMFHGPVPPDRNCALAMESLERG